MSEMNDSGEAYQALQPYEKDAVIAEARREMGIVDGAPIGTIDVAVFHEKLREIAEEPERLEALLDAHRKALTVARAAAPKSDPDWVKRLTEGAKRGGIAGPTT